MYCCPSLGQVPPVCVTGVGGEDQENGGVDNGPVSIGWIGWFDFMTDHTNAGNSEWVVLVWGL